MKSLLTLLVFLVSVHAQDRSPGGTIRGAITSESSGNGIANATIALKNSPFVTHTDTNGVYQLSKILPGVYDLTISAPGYMRMICYDLMVPPGIPLVFSIKLQVGNSEITRTMKILPPPDIAASMQDRILIYQPDSTIDFKLRIVNPEAKSRDSSAMKRK